MMRLASSAVVALSIFSLASTNLRAFCGFYISRADAKLFNRASHVVIARDGDRTVITMANDYEGDLREFAVVVPVPTVIRRDQVNVAKKALIDHLDAFTAPRLVEYFDQDPCAVLPMSEMASARTAMVANASRQDAASSARALGVRIEDSYTVGEYDILILSARDSNGLEQWLRENGYRLPQGASDIIGSYLKQHMRFFVAKVNMGEHAKLGRQYLRPLQVAYESPKFMLPIRLGTVNAKGAQELFIYTLTPRGRVETTNYRTVKLPTGMDLPVFVRGKFPEFYRAMFGEQVRREEMRTVFLEYAWDMGWCDPCAAEPLTADELLNLGVFWTDVPTSSPGGPAAWRMRSSGGTNVFVTRLHVRYDAAHFPEDLMFQETPDRTNFQGRYVLRHAWRGEATCEAAQDYQLSLRARQHLEATRLAELTGWPVDDIHRQMGTERAGAQPPPEPWWRALWRR
jgi:hypothetical protein